MKNKYGFEDDSEEMRYVMGKFVREYKYPTTFNLDAHINDNPHYSDKNFEHKEQTVFGKEEKGLGYDYSDRLWQWDWNKAEAASKTASEQVKDTHTARWHQAYLSAYFGKNIELKHIIAGVNWSNGYSYLIYGYKR